MTDQEPTATTSGQPQPGDSSASRRPASAPLTAEHARLAESHNPDSPWRLWGPYLAGRQWGTVREDYSADGDAWSSFPFDQAYARAYRWGEDGLGGICDRHGFINFGLAPVERQGPDPQGAAVRPDQRRGQPRRGRQGVLVGHRRHTVTQLDAVALPVPARGVPVPAAAGGEPQTRPGRAGVRARRHRNPGRRQVLRRADHLRQGRPGGPLHHHRRHQPRTGGRTAASAAADLAAQHLGVGPGQAAQHPAPAAAADPVGGRAGGRRMQARAARLLLPRRRGHPGNPVLRQRDQHGRPVRRREEPDQVHQGRHQQPGRQGQHQGDQPRELRDQGRVLVRPRTGRARARPSRSGCG